MNSNQDIIQPSQTSFHIRSAKFLCRPCKRQFSSVNPENGQASCPRCERSSNVMIEDAQQVPIQTTDLSTSRATTQQTQNQSQSQQPRQATFVRQTIYRPGQTVIIETISPEMQFGAQQTSQNTGFGFGNLFGFGGLSGLFGGMSQPSSPFGNPSDLFGSEGQQQQPQQNQQRQQGFFVNPFEMFFMPSPMMFVNTSDYERLIQEFLRNDPNNHGPAPAPEESIKKLKEFEYGTTTCKSTDCSVCQDEYKTGDKCVALPCEHNYHKDCVVEWLKRHDSCPVCRKPTTTTTNKQSDRMEEEIPQQQTGF